MATTWTTLTSGSSLLNTQYVTEMRTAINNLENTKLPIAGGILTGSVAIQSTDANFTIHNTSTTRSNCNAWFVSNNITGGVIYSAPSENAMKMRVFDANGANPLELCIYANGKSYWPGSMGLGKIPDNGIGFNLAQSNTDTAILIDADNTNTYDPYIAFRRYGTTVYTVGIDQADGNKFKISQGGYYNNFGIKDLMTLSDNGLETMSRALRVWQWGNLSADDMGKTLIGHNCYLAQDGTYKYANTHGAMGARGIVFPYTSTGSPMWFDMGNIATTKDVAFTPTLVALGGSATGSKFAQGSYAGDNTSYREINVGFIPSLVIVYSGKDYGATGDYSFYIHSTSESKRFGSSVSGSSRQPVIANSDTFAYPRLTTTGFMSDVNNGTYAPLNRTNVTYYWQAWG